MRQIWDSLAHFEGAEEAYWTIKLWYFLYKNMKDTVLQVIVICVITQPSVMKKQPEIMQTYLILALITWIQFHREYLSLSQSHNLNKT